MKASDLFVSFLALGACAVVSGCVSGRHGRVGHMTGDSMVFIGEEPSGLAWLPLPKTPFVLRSTYAPGSNSVQYVEGRDFAVDYSHGTVRRLPGFRVPDFQTNLLFGKLDFDHTRFPGYGNGPYFAFANYSFAQSTNWPAQQPQTQFLKSTQAKLEAGKAIKIVAFGDSITAGGEASKPELIFWQRWTDSVQRKYPGSKITAVNGATGGDTSVQGLERLQNKVLAEKPDLVLIAFGMNDHNIGGPSISQFEQNLNQMIARIRKETGAEIILVSTFPPNPKWHYGTHRMGEYAEATARVAQSAACAHADVFNNWQIIAAHKKPEDLLANNINHPNDFGHWIYYQVLAGLGL
jgi:lysophospholipase L1-like esterase